MAVSQQRMRAYKNLSFSKKQEIYNQLNHDNKRIISRHMSNYVTRDKPNNS